MVARPFQQTAVGLVGNKSTFRRLDFDQQNDLPVTVSGDNVGGYGRRFEPETTAHNELLREGTRLPPILTPNRARRDIRPRPVQRPGAFASSDRKATGLSAAMVVTN